MPGVLLMCFFSFCRFSSNILGSWTVVFCLIFCLFLRKKHQKGIDLGHIGTYVLKFQNDFIPVCYLAAIVSPDRIFNASRWESLAFCLFVWFWLGQLLNHQIFWCRWLEVEKGVSFSVVHYSLRTFLRESGCFSLPSYYYPFLYLSVSEKGGFLGTANRQPSAFS